jgi:hypothetical protein
VSGNACNGAQDTRSHQDSVLACIRELMDTIPWRHRCTDTSPQGLHAYCQKHWLRPCQYDRLDYAMTSHYASLMTHNDQTVWEKVIQVGKKHGFFTNVAPVRSSYKMILVMGSDVYAMVHVVRCLNAWVQTGQLCVDKGTRIMILVGDRPLTNAEKATVGCKDMVNEKDIAPWVWDKAGVCDALCSVGYTVVQAAKKKGTKRATTVDTVHALVKQHTVPSSVLVVSTNPFITYQGHVVRNVLVDRGAHETEVHFAGPCALIPQGMTFLHQGSILLDCLARTMYEMQKEHTGACTA